MDPISPTTTAYKHKYAFVMYDFDSNYIVNLLEVRQTTGV